MINEFLFSDWKHTEGLLYMYQYNMCTSTCIPVVSLSVYHDHVGRWEASELGAEYKMLHVCLFGHKEPILQI